MPKETKMRKVGRGCCKCPAVCERIGECFCRKYILLITKWMIYHDRCQSTVYIVFSVITRRQNVVFVKWRKAVG